MISSTLLLNISTKGPSVRPSALRERGKWLFMRNLCRIWFFLILGPPTDTLYRPCLLCCNTELPFCVSQWTEAPKKFFLCFFLLVFGCWIGCRVMVESYFTTPTKVCSLPFVSSRTNLTLLQDSKECAETSANWLARVCGVLWMRGKNVVNAI